MAESIFGVGKISYNLKKKVSAAKKALVRALLDETSNDIPVSARQSILDHWSQSPATIEFRDYVIPGIMPRIGGMTRDRGHLIIYRHDCLLRMPRNLAIGTFPGLRFCAGKSNPR